MELQQLIGMGFVGLMTIGFVNVMTFFFPNIDSKVKFGASVLFAFVLTFVPAEVGVLVVDKSKIALEAAFAASGMYKIVQKMGGA